MDRKSVANPFDSDAVARPEQSPPTDVPEIHSQPFDLCRNTYEAVAREHHSLSVLLYGEAGCGKTHLLSRFRRWLFGDLGERDAAPSVAPSVLVGIRMETAPSQIWRHIRRRFAEELTRRNTDGSCALDEMLRRFAAPSSGNLREALESAEIEGLSLDLSKVLEHFGAGNQRRLCRAWLVGDGLSDADLPLLNLSSGHPEQMEGDFAETNSREVVLAIARMSAPLPVVFCFDQVEGLGIAHQGARSFGRFSEAGATLIDGSPNVMVVSTILVEFLQDLLNDSVLGNYQRISKRQTDLRPLGPKQGRALIDSRLALVPGLEGHDPVPNSKLQALYEQQHGSCNARKLIHEARRIFAEWQESPPQPPVPMPQFLQAKFEALWTNSEVRTNPEKADAVLAHGLPVALELLGKRTASAAHGLTIGEGASRVEVVFANHTNMTSLAGMLRRLMDKKPPNPSLRLARDHRLPISPTATATRDRIKNIEQAGGRLVRVEAEALAALDAMRQLLTTATSGDLSLDGETIEARTVREWLASNLPPEVEKLAAALLGETAAPAPQPDADALIELIAKRKVVSLAEAAQAISWPKEKVENYARTHPSDIRWFGGICPVVCLAVGAAPAPSPADGMESAHAG